MTAMSLVAGTASVRALDLAIGFEAALHDAQAGHHVLGVREGAVNAVDPYDLPEPPPPPAGYLWLAFTMPEYDGPLANAWREEYRDPAAIVDGHSAIWHVVVATDVPAGDLVLTCDIDLGWGVVFTLRYLGPPYGEIEVPVPGTLAVPLTGAEHEFWLELTSEGEVDAALTTWGGVKALFR